MENERPEDERSSSTESATAGSPFALPAGYILQDYTIQGVIAARNAEIIYLASGAGGETVAIQEYFPEEMAMRLSDQRVSPILEKDEEGYRGGLERFLEAQAGGGSGQVFEANNTAYRVAAPAAMPAATPLPEAQALPISPGSPISPAAVAPWRYFAFGAGMALLLLIAGAIGYFISESQDAPDVQVAAQAPAVAPQSPVAPPAAASVPAPVPEAPSAPVATAPAPVAKVPTPVAAIPLPLVPIAPPVVEAGSPPASPAQADSPKIAAESKKRQARGSRHVAAKAGQTEVAERAEKTEKGDAKRTAAFVFDVSPSGRIYIDGKRIGETPPLLRVPVVPGWHRVEVHGSMPPGIYYYRFHLKPGEDYRIVARFSDSPY